MWILQVDQDGHSFSRARVEDGFQQAGKAEWRESFWYSQLCLGNHLVKVRSRVEFSQRKYRLYVTEPVTDAWKHVSTCFLLYSASGGWPQGITANEKIKRPRSPLPATIIA